MKIAITGHRPDAFLVSHYSFETVERIADDTVCVFKREFGDDLVFNLGGAIGTDQWVGKACLEHNVKFNLYLPFLPEVQMKYWGEEQKGELKRQIASANGIEIIDPSGQYNISKYQERNVKMIDDSNIVIAFWVGKRAGGTYNAIKYANSQSKFVFNALDNYTLIFKNDIKNGWTPKEGK
jgi:uncharacterized phage-like protein YoqJ